MKSNLATTYKVSTDIKYVYPLVEQWWHIHADGSRTVRCRKTLVFYAQPVEGDLVDTVLGSLDLGFDSLQYQTPDAEVQHYLEVRKDAVNIYWRPKQGAVEIAAPYTHEFTYHYPAGDGPELKSTTIASLAHIHTLRINISSDLPIDEFRVKRNEDGVEFWDTEGVFREDGKHIVSPIKSRSMNEVALGFKNMPPNTSYFVILRTVSK